MASIFLSYARDDAARAKALAKALERAGHEVWWDRHISGGSEFSDEIEAALKDAEVVLVLWSEASVRSAWVRDEAAEGRDSGRLVPVLLDDSAPPLGFRQVQSIPIAGWSGRGHPPNWQEMLKAVAARAGKNPAGAVSPAQPEPARRRQAVLAGLALLVSLLVAAGAWWLMGSRSAAAEAPTLAVLPFSDLSPRGDKAYFAEGVAEAILTVLAKEPGIKVIGRNSASQLQNAGKDAAAMRQALGVTHVLEGSARSAGDQLRMSVRLVDASDGRQLWAEEYQRQLDNVFAIQDEIGRSVAQKLRGSFSAAGQATQSITKADTYALYLAARSKMRDRRTSSLTDATGLARRVIAADPNYAPGHALLAELVWHLSTKGYGTIPEAKARSVAERHARRAIALAPDSPDGYAALGMISTREAAIEPLERAIRMDPARAELRQWLGHALNSLGRHKEALVHFRAAVEMDPLWVPGAMLLSYTLAASGKQEAAEQAIAAFERRGGSLAVAAKVRGDVANYRGDYSEALRLSKVALSLDPQTPQADLSAGWYHYMLGLYGDAARISAQFPLYTRLHMSGERDKLLAEVRAAGPQVWEQPDPNAAIDALAFARDWQGLALLYEAKPDISTVVCTDPEYTQMAISLSLALRATGRTAESERLLRCLRKILTEQGQGEIRSPYLALDWLNASWAQIHAIDGDPNRAFALMKRAVDHGARTPFGRGMSDLQAFDRYRTHPEYGRLDARLKQVMARERAEALADRRRAA